MERKKKKKPSESFKHEEHISSSSPTKKRGLPHLEFLCMDLHNQCDNVLNQCYFIFCIVVHNGIGHILLLDFLWVHSNSLN